MSIFIDKVAVLARAKEFSKAKSDTAFAEYIGVPATTLSSWKSRKTFDLDILYAKCVGVNMDWLLTGQGEMLRTEGKSPTGISSEKETLYKEMLAEKDKEIARLNRENGRLAEKLDTFRQKDRPLNLHIEPLAAPMVSDVRRDVERYTEQLIPPVVRKGKGDKT